ncbi:hypothetical protein GBAR_LOCUS1847 [Geodia barretti]|uniref:UBA domain-containing protein n=1 Tax=Geodia barretti TaxID=519541 RepID=A0AA35QXN6_GEOBA|nr:hypothetical protein GBAR_LOCUS1847 [Geodia barretti]
MKALLRLHRVKYCVKDSGQARVDHLSQQVGQILELAGGSDFETIIIPSEASAEHPGVQLMHGTVHPSSLTTPTVAPGTVETEELGEEDDGSLGLPSLGVTPADLASALASIDTEQSDSQHSSMSVEMSSQPPLSLPVLPPNVSGTSAPASLQESELLSVPPPPTVNRSLSDSGHGNTGTRHDASGPTSSSSSSISQMDLQQALSQVLSTAQRHQQAGPVSTSHQSPRTPSQHRPRHRHGGHQSRRETALRERYTAHLEQLHAMGITYSDSECLHALEAADGDLQTALEILMGDPNH